MKKYIGGIMKKRSSQRDSRIQGQSERALAGWDSLTGRALGAVSGGRLGRERRRRAEEVRSGQVREFMKNIDHINNGDELATAFQQARNNVEREAILRRAASLGATGAILGRTGHANDRVGFGQFMEDNFGDNNATRRLAETIAGLEDKNHNHRYHVSAYNAGTNQYEWHRGALGAGDPVRDSIFAAAGGEHPQNVARGIRADDIITNVPGGPQRFNTDFENFLTDLGSDFRPQFTSGGPGNQLDQIPNTVIRQLQNARTAGIHPPAGSNTEYLVNQLVAAGRLT